MRSVNPVPTPPACSFYNNLSAGDITMPWASILGFVDVFALMVTAIWLAWRHERSRRRGREPSGALPAASQA
jgi:hypothetical protein